MNRRAVFLDLNGTLALPVIVETLPDLKLIDGADEAVARLSEAGLACPVVTVQSRIAKGYFTEREFRDWFSVFSRPFRTRGAALLGPYICPHRFSEPCGCKKPQTYLYEQAAAEHDLALARSFVIGDSAADMEAAHRFEGVGCLVRTGWGLNGGEVQRASAYASYVADTMAEAVEWVLWNVG